MRSSKIKVSVIIPTYNSWATLKSCIASIYKQSLSLRDKQTLLYEVIVVDNGSTDNTSLKVKKYFPRVKLITLNRNTGVTGGRNAGIDKANKNSQYLLFFDHDMIAARNMLKNLVSVALMYKHYGIVTPKIYYWEEKKRIWAAGTNINLWTGQVSFRGGLDKGQFERVEPVQVAPACILVKRKVIDKLIGFDTRYFATFEDSDFCFRARALGFSTIYAPSAISYHKIARDLSLSNKRLLSRAYWIGRNRIAFMSSHGESFYLFLLISPVYLLYFLILSLSQSHVNGFINYLNGYFSGLIEYLLNRRLLVRMPFSTYWSLERAIGSGKRSILDVGCGEGKKISILNHHKKWQVTGIEIYKADAAIARNCGAYKDVIIGNLKNLYKIFKGKKFDVVFCSEVVEHMKKHDGIGLIEDMEKLGKRIVISTPKGFVEKHEACFFEGENIYQLHLSGWGIEEFRNMGYKVNGTGLNFIHIDNTLTQKVFMGNSALLFLENIFAYILSPLPFYFPSFATTLIALKDIKLKK